MKSILTIFVSIILVFSCTNPFTTRDPEQPNPNEGSDIFDQPISYEIVLSNLRYALIQKNLDHYMSCLIDTTMIPAMVYNFIPDQSAQIERFINWGLSDEQNYLRNVFTNSKTLSFEFVDKNITYNSITTSEDSVQTSLFRYTLQVMFDTLATYNGKARMKLVKNANSLWAIYFWEDQRDDTITNNRNTWSTLKALYK